MIYFFLLKKTSSKIKFMYHLFVCNSNVDVSQFDGYV